MKSRIASILLVLVGLLNVTPAVVFFDPSRSLSLYGVELRSDDLGIIVRHRAVLLGLLGAAMIFAAFRREFIVPVVIAALVGKVAFLYLVFTTTSHTGKLGSDAMFDVAAIAVLVIALALSLGNTRSSGEAKGVD